jgi:hypothetical protein
MPFAEMGERGVRRIDDRCEHPSVLAIDKFGGLGWVFTRSVTAGPRCRPDDVRDFVGSQSPGSKSQVAKRSLLGPLRWQSCATKFANGAVEN